MIINDLYSKQTLAESILIQDPVYRQFKSVGRYIAERKMSEKEILQVFADAETGMTDKATGANRTMLGRGKDTTTKFAGDVKNAVSSVLNSIQNSVPVSAVDVAYDQATDALGNLAGGQKGKVMQAIKGYRNLVKQYPKTAGFAKAALVAITGLATGGASLPVIAGLTYALDSAIRGDKLSSVLGKGVGASAVTWGGQQLAGALGGGDASAATSQQPAGMDYSYDNFVTANPTTTMTQAEFAAQQAAGGQGAAAADASAGFGGAEATDYVVKKGDTLSDIAKANKVSVDDLMKANAGQTIVKPDGESITWNDANALSDVDAMGNYQGSGTGAQQDYSVSKAPKISNPDVLAAGQTIKIPAPTGATPYAGDVGLAGDTWKKIGAGQYPYSQISANQAAKAGLIPDAGGAAAGPEPLGGGAAVDAAGATTPPAPSAPMLNFTDGNSGTLTLPDGSQVPVSAFPAGGIQPRLGPGTETISVNYAGQDVTAYIKNGKAYIKNFNPEEFSNPVQESWLPAVTLRMVPANKLIKQRISAISEGKAQSKSTHLTAFGVFSVFENVNRYRNAIMELKGVPGSTRPAYYRPDMPGGPGKQSKPGLIGRGLNWLDKKAGQVGGALSNFGHQFTTDVTKEKLKMNWHQAGKPSDSDQLAAWLVKQGVPQEIVTSVYSKMGIPYTAPAVTPTVTPTVTPKTQTQTQTVANKRSAYTNNPYAVASAPVATTTPATTTPATTTPAATAEPSLDLLKRATASLQGGPALSAAELQQVNSYRKSQGAPAMPGAGPSTFNAANIMKLPGMEKYAKTAAPAKTPNFAGPSGYGKTTTSVKPMTGIPGMKTPAIPAAPTAPKAPAAPKVTSGGPTAAEKDKLAQRIAQAVKEPVAEMLSMVETKEDVAKIKQFVDQTFVKYNAVSESAFVVRNQLIEHITKVGAQRRREFAQKSI
jgi:hypothetical protein